MEQVPHYTTLQKASHRLLKLKDVRKLLARTIRRIHRRRGEVPYAAADSSGFEAHHASRTASRYFIHRHDTNKADTNRPKKKVSYKYFGKLMIIVCCMSHFILGAVASRGPTPDIDQLREVLEEVPESLKLRHLVLDAGFDAGNNHRLLREERGICSTIPPEHGRPSKDPQTLPTDKYRHLMKTRFNKRVYRKPGRDGLLDAQAKLGVSAARQEPPLPPPRHAAAGADSQHHARVIAGFSTEPTYPLFLSGGVPTKSTDSGSP